jgi:hypothetical protein
MNKVESGVKNSLSFDDIFADIQQKGEVTNEHLKMMNETAAKFDADGMNGYERLGKLMPEVGMSAKDAEAHLRKMKDTGIELTKSQAEMDKNLGKFVGDDPERIQ